MQMADFIIPSDKVIMQMIENLDRKVGSNLEEDAKHIYITKVLSPIVVKDSICKKINLHINLTRDQTHNPLK
jgi:hypothetical protein